MKYQIKRQREEEKPTRDTTVPSKHRADRREKSLF